MNGVVLALLVVLLSAAIQVVPSWVWGQPTSVDHHELARLQEQVQRLSGQVEVLLQSLEEHELNGSGDQAKHSEPGLLGTLGLSGVIGLTVVLMSRLGAAFARVVHEHRLYAQGTKEDGRSNLQVGLSQFLTFRVEAWIASTPRWKELVLGGFVLVLVVAGGLVLWAVSGDATLGEAVWLAWVYVVDTAAHANAPEGSQRAVALVITVGGMLVFSFLVSILTDNLASLMAALKEGKDQMVLRDHTVLLGWSELVVPLIEEIAEANASEGGGTVVILSQMDKEAVESEITMRLRGKLQGTEVKCRHGAPFVMQQLELVSVRTARSAVVLSDSNRSPDEADKDALRIVLCLRAMEIAAHGSQAQVDVIDPGGSSPSRVNHILAGTRRGKLSLLPQDSRQAVAQKPHVVVEMRDIDNEALLKALAPWAEAVVTHDFIGRLLVKTALERRVADVFCSMFGFKDSEFYREKWPALVGKTFAEIPFMFDDAVVLGMQTARGEIILCPDTTETYMEGDELIVLAEDNDSYQPRADLSPAVTYEPGPVPAELRGRPAASRVLICGWRRDIADMVEELECICQPHSEVHILAPLAVEERGVRMREKGRDILSRLSNLSLMHHVGDPLARSDLGALSLEDFNTVLVVCDEEQEPDGIVADGRTMATCLLIKDIVAKRDGRGGGPQIICEMLDSRSEELMRTTQLADIIMSKKVCAGVISMIEEDQGVASLLRLLLSPTGFQVSLMSPARYFGGRPKSTPEHRRGAPTLTVDTSATRAEARSFWELTARARDRGEVALGYIQQGALVLNPPEKGKPVLLAPSRGDVVIVLQPPRSGGGTCSMVSLDAPSSDRG
mmetsp:Transcript_64469/g.172637  ORF Transcript_64469/g.172637 Transcript_64469/m.172637 type:complete len:842 (-) Transcript_64469:240-2765(-)